MGKLIYISVTANVVLALAALVLVLSWSGARFSAPWDGPEVMTLVLTAATVVLTGVAVLAALLAVWGFGTLREHAGHIAKQAADEAISKAAPASDERMHAAAEAAAERVVKKWLGWPEGDSSNDIAEAYGREGAGHA